MSCNKAVGNFLFFQHVFSLTHTRMSLKKTSHISEASVQANDWRVCLPATTLEQDLGENINELRIITLDMQVNAA